MCRLQLRLSVRAGLVPVLHSRMGRALSKAAWQHQPVLGSGAGCDCCHSAGAHQWCLCHGDQQAVPAWPLGLVLLSSRGSFLAGLLGMAGAENSVVFMQLGLDPACKYGPFPCFSDA